MKTLRRCAPIVLLSAMYSPALAIDAFDRHTSFWLEQAIKKNEPRAEMSSGKAAELKLLGPGVHSPCVVVKTANGHFAKALLSWGLRRTPEKSTPVLLIERYVTYDADRRDVALAAGKNVMLFPGFQFNFELGQVVPEGQGGDVTFNDMRRLLPVGKAQLFGLDGPALPPAAETKPDPTDHEGVLPRDFSGTWQVDADGRWTGVWELAVDDDGNVHGQYTSDDSKSTYPLKGQVTGLPHRVALDVELANATQQFEGYLWTKDKSTVAGTTTLSERKFGFVAKRMKEQEEKKP